MALVRVIDEEKLQRMIRNVGTDGSVSNHCERFVLGYVQMYNRMPPPEFADLAENDLTGDLVAIVDDETTPSIYRDVWIEVEPKITTRRRPAQV